SDAIKGFASYEEARAIEVAWVKSCHLMGRPFADHHAVALCLRHIATASDMQELRRFTMIAVGQLDVAEGDLEGFRAIIEEMVAKLKK
ncbi:MAG: hypothetical protein LPH21_17630, partial [Shewanella sp.]|nr:hypothetical protein [Shewanella sp.]